MSLKLKFPCSQDLNSMASVEAGKYCSQCDKTLIDFTNWEKEDIMKYVSSRSACGIFRTNQLDEVSTRPIVHIKPKRHWVAKFAAAMSVLVLAFMGCDSDQSINKNSSSDNTEEAQKEDCHLTLGMPINPRIERIDSLDDIKVGQSFSDEGPDIKGIVSYDEMMPEFVGGEDSLVNYLATNIRYPSYEKEKRIQGTIYAEFIIDEEGRVVDPKILESVAGSRNFDKEVKRALLAMPKWRPGMRNGKAVQVAYVLPIEFEL